MNRLISRILALVLWPMALWGQTAAVPPQQVTSTSPTIPSGVTLCNVPKNGGACTTATTINLKPVTLNLSAQTAPVTLAGFKGTFTFTLPFAIVPMPQYGADGKLIATVYVVVYSGPLPPPEPDANGNITLTNIAVTVTPQ